MTTSIASTVDEAFANNRLYALIAEHNLPEPSNRMWFHHSYESSLAADRHTLIVRAATFAEVDQWAVMLDARRDTDHTVVDADHVPDTWIVDRTHMVRIADWLPGVNLRISHSEVRLAPGGAS
jgi:hypothetical protein